MKDKTKIVINAILLGVFAWAIDAVLDYFLCETNSFCEAFFLGLPMDRVFSILEIFILLLFYGLWLAKRITDDNRRTLAYVRQKQDLGERVKELNYLYGLDPSSETSLDEVLQTAVYLIAYSWQNPDNTCVRITLRDEVFATDNFKETSWSYSSGIRVQGTEVGEVQVYSLEENLERDEKLAQKEDQFLVDTIAAQLEKIIGGAWAEEAIQRQVDYLEALNRSLQYFQANLEDVEKIQEGVSWLAIELFKVKMAWLGLVNGEEYEVHLAASSGFSDAQLESIQAAWHDGNSGRDLTQKVLQSGSPEAMQHILTDPAHAAWCETAETCGFYSSATLPLVAGDRVMGVLNLYHQQPEFFDGELMPLLQLFADQVSVALSNAMLMEQIKTKRGMLQTLSRQLVESQEAERQMLAAELQEKIGQILTGVNLTIGAIEVQSGPAQENLETAKIQISDLISLLRDMSQDLRPTMLDNSGLLPALLWYFGRYNAQTGVNVEFKHHDIDRRFPPDKEITLYRVVQGILTDVAQDKDVKEVEIDIRHEDDILRFTIENQLDLSNNHKESNYGLIEMAERVNASGGRLSVSAASETSCLIVGELPVKGKYLNRRKERRD